jgi:UDP-N-acetylmuramyl pentapeptide phosphotransferase/UDP-N-acetylglucosamine-1-phosphate transferase
MTIREYFRARSKRARRVLGMGGLVAVVAVTVATLAMTDHIASVYCYPATGAAVLGVAIMFGGLLYLDLTKCPQCLARLGIQVANQYRFGRRVDFCPFCGVGFDKCEMRDP